VEVVPAEDAGRLRNRRLIGSRLGGGNADFKASARKERTAVAEKTVQPQQRSFRFSMAEPVVSRRIDIQIDVERVEGGPNTCDWIIRWRTSESGAEFVERLCRSLLELCVPKPIWTDNALTLQSQRKGADDDGRR
jgi:hypothetical protein